MRPDPFYDQLGSHGFVVDGFGYRIGYATDLGHVPWYFIDRFRDLDCIVLEANYDPQMQADSALPSLLKRHIMGGHGHLSNRQALAAAQRHGRAAPRSAADRVVPADIQRRNEAGSKRVCSSVSRRLRGSLRLLYKHRTTQRSGKLWKSSKLWSIALSSNQSHQRKAATPCAFTESWQR
jgi:Beta-lactamase superfamily domain